MGVCFLGNQSRQKSSSSILRNSQVVLQGTEQVARSQSEKPLTSSEGSVTCDERRDYAACNSRSRCANSLICSLISSKVSSIRSVRALMACQIGRVSLT